MSSPRYWKDKDFAIAAVAQSIDAMIHGMTFGVRHKDLGRGARQKGGVFSVSGEWWENQK